jgi:FG-GAP-like repeat
MVVRWTANTELRSRLSGPGFTEITAQCLDFGTSGMAQLLPGIDDWRTALDAASGIDVYGNHGIAVGDIDGSGFDSFYVCQPSGLPNRLYRNRGDGTFEDVTEKSGVGILDGTASALFVDFLNCGRQDLLVVRSGGPLLFTNMGDGRFEVKTDAFHFARPPQGTFTSAAVADYNRDGLLDIYFCVYSYYQGLNQYQFPSPYYDAQNGPPNFLFRNRGDGTFEDVTMASGVDQQQPV